MTKYKVALTGGRWKRGFNTLDAAVTFESGLRRKDGVYRAIEAYTPKSKAAKR